MFDDILGGKAVFLYSVAGAIDSAALKGINTFTKSINKGLENSPLLIDSFIDPVYNGDDELVGHKIYAILKSKIPGKKLSESIDDNGIRNMVIDRLFTIIGHYTLEWEKQLDG